MSKICSRLGLDHCKSRGCAEGDLGLNEQQGEQGFMLVGLIVAIFIILLVLGIAAPKVSQDLKREREVEAMHRGNQYVRAIQLYYRKNGGYPGNMDALLKGTAAKYLRQEYVDPMTGKADWKLIHVGEAKTTVKGFFGQPLTGMAPGLGSASGMASPGGIGTGAAGTGGSNSAFGGSSGSSGSAFGSASSGASGPGSGAFGAASSGGLGSSNSAGSGGTSGASGSGTGTTGTGTGSTGTGAPNTLGSASGIASQSSGGFSGSGAPFVGVGIPKDGTSIVVLNEQTTYNTWEFIYDPRIEQMKAAAALLNGGGSGTSGLGSAGGINSGVGGAGAPGSGFGSSGSSGFGSSGSSGFGSSSGSGFGSSPTSGSPGNGTQSPTTPQQPQ